MLLGSYNHTQWTQWRNKFQAQSGTTYVSQSGTQMNAGRGNGVIQEGGEWKSSELAGAKPTVVLEVESHV